jgi:phage replication O-like protein O
MANPQKENGHTQISNEILEEMARRKFNGTQNSILLVVLRFTYGFNRKSHDMSLTFFEKATGIKKTRLSEQLKILIEKNVLIVVKESGFAHISRQLGFNKDYEKWEIEYWNSSLKKEQLLNEGTVTENYNGTVPENMNRTVPEKGNQEIKDKDNINTFKKEEENPIKKIWNYWDQNGFGFHQINQKEKLAMWTQEGDFDEPYEIVLKALEVAADKGVTNYAYVNTILNDWAKRKFKTLESVMNAQKEFQAKITDKGHTKQNELPKQERDEDNEVWLNALKNGG